MVVKVKCVFFSNNCKSLCILLFVFWWSFVPLLENYENHIFEKILFFCFDKLRNCSLIDENLLGPASRDPEILEKMMETGMNVARLNFSHGTHEYHAETIKNIRTAVANYSKKIGQDFPLAIALDTKGPEIRTGLLEGVCLPLFFV